MLASTMQFSRYERNPPPEPDTYPAPAPPATPGPGPTRDGSPRQRPREHEPTNHNDRRPFPQDPTACQTSPPHPRFPTPSPPGSNPGTEEYSRSAQQNQPTSRRSTHE